MFSCEICEFFKSTYVEEHLRTTTSTYTQKNFRSMFPFYIPWKHQKTRYFFIFSEAIIEKEAVVQRYSVKNVLKNFAKFTGKHLCQSLFFNKVAGRRPATLLKKRLWRKCFPGNFAKFLRKPFLSEHLRRLLLKMLVKQLKIRSMLTIKALAEMLLRPWQTFNPLSSNLTKLSSTLKTIFGCCRRIFWVCLTIFGGLALKRLREAFIF